jgi:hypothetical protein
VPLVESTTGEFVSADVQSIWASKREGDERNAALQNALTRAGRDNARLQGELSKRDKLDPVDAKVQLAYNRWRELCRPGARSRPGPKRSKALGAAIRRDGFEPVMRAIYGVSRFPFTSPQGRVATGTADRRHDELELIVRDEVKVAAHQKLAFRAMVEDGVIRPGQRPDIVDLLGTKYGENQIVELLDAVDVPLDGVAEWWAPCPNHERVHVGLAPMRVRWGGDGQPVYAGGRKIDPVDLVCVRHRCEPSAIFEALAELRAPVEVIRAA